MEIMEINDVKKIFLRKKPIGVGNTARCYVTKGGEVIKLYKHNYDAHVLLRDKDYASKLERISLLSNDSYICPEKLIYQNKKLIGYIYKYVNPKDLAQISNNTLISELLGTNLEKLIEDTKKISNQKFLLYDIHSRNILYNDSYKVIDLDKGTFYDKDTYENILRKNSSYILRTILYHIYNIKEYHYITYNDINIDDYIYNKDMFDMNVINNLLDEFKNICNCDEPTIQMVRKKSKIKKEYNSYYDRGIMM